jgi:hypothetical protein
MVFCEKIGGCLKREPRFRLISTGLQPGVGDERDIQAVLTASCGRKTVETVIKLSITCSPG